MSLNGDGSITCNECDRPVERVPVMVAGGSTKKPAGGCLHLCSYCILDYAEAMMKEIKERAGYVPPRTLPFIPRNERQRP